MLSISLALGVYFSAGAISVSALANTYYVSSTGSDSNACTQSAPCKTITKGISVAQNGDTVVVSAGVYHENVYVNKSISLISSGAIIDGANATGTVRDGLVSVYANSVKVQGFNITNAPEYGLANFGSNSQFVSNVIHKTQGPGIWMRDGQFNSFEGNELYDTVLQNSVSFDGTHYTCNPNASSWPSAINSWGAAASNIWRGNNVHDNCGEGIVVVAGDLVENNSFKNNWSVEVYIISNGAIVRNNTIVDTKPYAPRGSDQSWRSVPAGISIGDEEVCLADNSTITGNSIAGSRYGVSFYAYISCSGVKNSLIENNSILNTWEYGLRILSGSHTNSTIRNNKVQLTSGRPLTIQGGGFTVTGNTFFSNTSVFEWNGKTYDFTGWNNVVPGNFWAGASATPTVVVTATLPAATQTPTTLPTQTSIPPTVGPTFTATPVPPAATAVPTQTSVPPTVVPTFTATSVPATATPTALPPVTATAIPPTAEPPSPTPVPPTVVPTSEPPTATAVPQNPPATETIYDDTDGAFAYSREWGDVYKAGPYNGSYKSTNRDGSYATFTFTGQSFSVIYSGGYTFRAMNVYVDDALVGTIDERAPESTFQQRWDYSGQLTPGQHVLKFVFVASGRRTNGSIDAVIVR
jgi:hypothetical protein